MNQHCFLNPKSKFKANKQLEMISGSMWTIHALQLQKTWKLIEQQQFFASLQLLLKFDSRKHNLLQTDNDSCKLKHMGKDFAFIKSPFKIDINYDNALDCLWTTKSISHVRGNLLGIGLVIVIFK